MRILQVADFYPPTPGGLEAHVARLSEQLAARGHEVAVAAGGGKAVAAGNEGLTVHRFGLSLERLSVFANGRAFHPPWADHAFVSAVLGVAKHFRPDVIHAHGWSEFSAVKVGRQLEVPVVVTLHDYGLCCPAKSLYCGVQACRSSFGFCCLTCTKCPQGVFRRTGLAMAIRLGRRRLTREVARYISVSEYVAQAHRAVGVDDDKTIIVIPNFVDSADIDFKPPPADGPIVFVGPAARYKGRPVLERAFRDIPLYTRPRLWLVGDTPPPTTLNQDVGVDHLGRRSGAEILAIFQASRVAVVPSVWQDPCPTVALEASAVGRPVIASQVGGLKDIVVSEETGLLVPPDDPIALADALKRLIDDYALTLKLGAAARERFLHHFSAAVVIPRIEQLYREVLSWDLV